MRHFIDLKDFDSDRLQAMLETAAQIKSGTDKSQPLAGKYVGMIFEKPSTRTRVSFSRDISAGWYACCSGSERSAAGARRYDRYSPCPRATGCGDDTRPTP